VVTEEGMSAQFPVANEELTKQREGQGSLKKETVRRTVLVVEDDPAGRELVMDILTEWGYRAIPVGSAEEAEFAVRSQKPDAAIVDVFLPGKSGATLMSRLRERFPDIVLVGVSALSDAAMARRCKGLGADAFIGKPFSEEKLAEALKAGHRSWH
jgi:CheY-like chemotaxis protein